MVDSLRTSAEQAQAAYRAEPSHANRQAYERAVRSWNAARALLPSFPDVKSLMAETPVSTTVRRSARNPDTLAAVHVSGGPDAVQEVADMLTHAGYPYAREFGSCCFLVTIVTPF